MDAGANGSDGEAENARQPRRKRRRALAVGVAVAALLIGIVWSERGDIADHEIGTILRQRGIAATWHVEAIGLREQVIADVVVGDPAHPDLTIERVITSAGLQGGVPGLNAVTLINPHLYGSLRGGKLSFGSLDKLLNGPSTGPFRLPDLALRIDNGRGLITGDGGAIGLGLSGAGPLRDGFSGALVAVANHLDLAGCAAANVKLSSHIGVAAERPRLTGPVQLASLHCASAGVQLGAATLPLDLRAFAAFDGGEGRVGWSMNAPGIAAARAASTQGGADLTLHNGAVTARVTGSLRGIQAGHLAASSFAFDAMLRTDTGLSHVTAEGTLDGKGLAPADEAWQKIDEARVFSADTPAGPLLARIAQVVAREAPGSHLSGRFMLHHAGASSSLILPEAQLTGGSGATLLTVSRGGVILSAGARPQLSGHFVTGGPLPLIAGEMARGSDGRDRLSVTMANYRAGSAAVAVPALALTMAQGTMTMAGDAVLSGPLPGGVAQNLYLPIVGSWTSRGLKLWPSCTRVTFDRLALASLTLLRDGLTACPRRGGAIVQMGAGMGARGTSIAAGVPTFDLAGQIGGSPVHLTGGPLGVAVLPGKPGTLFGQAVSVTLGEGLVGTSHFRLNRIDAQFGSTVTGHFSGSDVDLAAVPLNLRNLGGDWRYDGGVLTIANAAFQVEDREQPPRFQPLVARDGTLTLAQGVITAHAVLREPHSDRAITRLAIRHDLDSGTGHADLGVDGISFDKGLQPETLSPLLLGIVADVAGTVRGQGTIDWAGGRVTSHARFASDSLDFAAAFGPVKGVSGAVNFTDLLGLVSAPDQQLKIAAINPGVEVDDGVLTFALLPGHVLAVEGATWPFLDGHLRLLPTRLTLGAAEVRRYEMRVEGVDAAKFLVRMNMSNLTATGIFDGGLPLVFDQAGGKIVGGMLTARAPGGSVSYVGALSYKDLSPMANYAFETLKSLNYKQLNIGLDGSLSGNIFTRVSMRGVTQGPGARRNFITRQIGKLPIQFNVNIHAPFYMLLTNFKSLYDSSYLPDPRTLGLLGADGKPVAHPAPPPVQPPVIETKP